MALERRKIVTINGANYIEIHATDQIQDLKRNNRKWIMIDYLRGEAIVYKKSGDEIRDLDEFKEIQLYDNDDSPPDLIIIPKEKKFYQLIENQL